MSRLTIQFGLLAVLSLLALGTPGGSAQTAVTNRDVKPTTGTTIKPSPTDTTLREGVILRTENLLKEDTESPSTTVTVRPVRPEQDQLSPEVRDRLLKFRKAAQDYLRKQEELKKLLRNATDKERDLIRQRLRENRERWLESARQFQKETKERIRELRRDVPALREALEEQRNAVKESTRPPRPGLD